MSNIKTIATANQNIIVTVEDNKFVSGSIVLNSGNVKEILLLKVRNDEVRVEFSVCLMQGESFDDFIECMNLTNVTAKAIQAMIS